MYLSRQIFTWSLLKHDSIVDRIADIVNYVIVSFCLYSFVRVHARAWAREGERDRDGGRRGRCKEIEWEHAGEKKQRERAREGEGEREREREWERGRGREREGGREGREGGEGGSDTAFLRQRVRMLISDRYWKYLFSWQWWALFMLT